MIQDMLVLVKQGKQEEATELLRHLRQVRMGRFLLGRWGAACLGGGEKATWEQNARRFGKREEGARSVFAGSNSSPRRFGEAAEELEGGRGAGDGKITPGRCFALSAARNPAGCIFPPFPSLLVLIALGFAACTAHSRRFPLNFQKVWCLKQICKSAEAI